MPKKVVKFDKKKHKINPWMTRGILNSLNSKNKLYRTILQTNPNSDIYDTLQTNYKTYKSIIRRSIMLAKRQYYHTASNIHSNNLKKTWKTINDVLNRNNKKHNLPISFKSKNGALITSEKEIANSFNDYFINICNDTNKSENKSDSYSTYIKI